MGKMVTALIIVALMELSLQLFTTSGATETSLITFLTDPSTWSLASFLDLIVGNISLLVGASAIVAGLYFYSRDNAIYAGFASIALGFGILLARFWAFIYSQAVLGDSAWVIATLICLPVFIFYLITVFDYGRKPDG